MTTSNSSHDIEFGGPATYRVVVQGALDQKWGERLAGMTITVAEQTGRKPHSTLFGWIRDQAELIGVLDTLHDLHLPILEVESVEGKPDTTGGEKS